MESAALFFVTSSLGVMFGWQPLPDGTGPNGIDTVEYIVQIEPELAKTLRAGHSIPITSDIPNDIGPIGRIRIVVGSDDLPRQKLAARFKPWPTKQSPEDVVETQYTVPPVQSSGTGRYGAQQATNNQILPPGTSGAAQQNPFGRALQQGAEQARQLNKDAQNQILPPANEIFANGTTSGQGVRNALDNSANQLRQGLQRNVAQVADRTGQQLRNAVDDAGRGAQEAIDKFGRSLTPEQRGSERSILSNTQNQNNNTILPPGGQTNDQLGATKRRIDQPIQPQRQLPQPPPANYAESSQGTSNPTSKSGVFNAPWPPVGSNLPPANTAKNSPTPSPYGNQNRQPNSANSQWPGNSTPRENFDLARRSSQQSPTQGPNDRYANLNTASNGMEGPKFPGANDQPTARQSASNPWPQQQSAPEIRRDMLEQPQGSNNMQTVGNPSPGVQHQTAARPPLDTQPRDLGWNKNNGNTLPENSESNGATTLFPLLLSWVLLSGSGAGNLYLFWSYLDVRNKYQGMVHGYNSRRERYDD